MYQALCKKFSMSHETRKLFTLKIGTNFLVIPLIVLICIGFSCCGKAPDEKEDNIRAVIQTMFTCPNTELINALPVSTNTTKYEKPDDEAISRYERILKEMYAHYFTEKGYKQFAYSDKYHVLCHSFGYQTEVKQLLVAQDKNKSADYTATFVLNYRPVDGTKAEINITVHMSCDKEGKIDYTWVDYLCQREIIKKIH